MKNAVFPAKKKARLLHLLCLRHRAVRTVGDYHGFPAVQRDHDFHCDADRDHYLAPDALPEESHVEQLPFSDAGRADRSVLCGHDRHDLCRNASEHRLHAASGIRAFKERSSRRQARPSHPAHIHVHRLRADSLLRHGEKSGSDEQFLVEHYSKPHLPVELSGDPLFLPAASAGYGRGRDDRRRVLWKSLSSDRAAPVDTRGGHLYAVLRGGLLEQLVQLHAVYQRLPASFASAVRISLCSAGGT